MNTSPLVLARFPFPPSHRAVVVHAWSRAERPWLPAAAPIGSVWVSEVGERVRIAPTGFAEAWPAKAM
jgi:hypothetical protein